MDGAPRNPRAPRYKNPSRAATNLDAEQELRALTEHLAPEPLHQAKAMRCLPLLVLIPSTVTPPIAPAMSPQPQHPSASSSAPPRAPVAVEPAIESHGTVLAPEPLLSSTTPPRHVVLALAPMHPRPRRRGPSPSTTTPSGVHVHVRTLPCSPPPPNSREHPPRRQAQHNKQQSDLLTTLADFTHSMPKIRDHRAEP